jgi:hypothetical protein
MNGAVRGVILGTLVAIALASCIVKRLTGPKLTGTCAGACDHYVSCKSGHPQVDADRCNRECPDVFSDREALMEFERLSCEDAVEYVDGPPRKAASAQ